MIKNKLLWLPLAAMGMLGLGSANAETYNMTVSAEVAPFCLLSLPTTVDLGEYKAGDNTVANLQISVQCTQTTAYSVGIDAGLTMDGVNNRTMMSADSKHLMYFITIDGLVWGDAGEELKTGVGNGEKQNLVGSILVPAQQYVPSGSYSDQLVVSLVY